MWLLRHTTYMIAYVTKCIRSNLTQFKYNTLLQQGTQVVQTTRRTRASLHRILKNVDSSEYAGRVVAHLRALRLLQELHPAVPYCPQEAYH